MQSFASPPPTPIPHPTKITHHKSNTTNLCPTHTKRAQLSLIPTPFLPKNHRKGATIACFGEKYYYLCKKQINHNYYDKQRINRKSL